MTAVARGRKEACHRRQCLEIDLRNRCRYAGEIGLGGDKVRPWLHQAKLLHARARRLCAGVYDARPRLTRVLAAADRSARRVDVGRLDGRDTRGQPEGRLASLATSSNLRRKRCPPSAPTDYTDPSSTAQRLLEGDHRMNRGIYSMFVAALASAVLVAGCGGSSNKSTTTTSSSSTTTAKTTAAQTSSSTPSATATVPSGANVGAAIAADCERALAIATSVTAAEKSQLKAYCAAFVHDTPAQIKATEKTLCGEITKFVPAADRALAETECKNL